MVNTCTEKIYGVLEKYDIKYTEDGVKNNLDEWKYNKSGLLNLLRKHPNWNEEALAVIFEVTESRDIDRYWVRNYRRDVFNLSFSLEITDENRDNLELALRVATDSYTKILANKQDIENIKTLSGIKCTTGQKTSRVINKICQKYGLDKHPEFNARFAKLADSLNPLQVKKTALLSVHPCDYLEMSNRNNSWSSCHLLNGGEYSAGTLSYMNDEVSMIFYTVDDDISFNYYQAPKRTREVFCYKDGILLQSRLYPKTEDEETKEIYRNIVQQTIASCLSVPNLWTLKKEQREVDQYYETHSDALHYEDYTHEDYKSNVSLLKSVHNDENNTICIGYTSYCVSCSSELTENKSIACECVNYVTCADCGERIREDYARWVDDDYYCDDCVSYCGHCGNYTNNETHTVYDRRGDEITVCDSCFEDDFYYCEECDKYYHPDYGNYVNNYFYCQDCLEKHFYTCHDCGEYVSDNDAIEIDGYFYCESCSENIQAEDENECA